MLQQNEMLRKIYQNLKQTFETYYEYVKKTTETGRVSVLVLIMTCEMVLKNEQAVFCILVWLDGALLLNVKVCIHISKQQRVVPFKATSSFFF